MTDAALEPPRSATTSARRRAAADAALVALAALVDLGFWGGGTALRWSGEVPGVLVVATTALAFVFVRRRSRHPAAAYGVSWIHATTWGVLLPTYEPFTALLLCTYHLARWRSGRTAMPYLLALAVPWGVNTVNGAAGTRTDAAGTLAIAAVWVGITAGVWVAARHSRRSAALARLREQSYAAMAALAVHEQRLALARDIHDTVAHAVSAIAVQAGGARAVARSGDPRVEGALAAIETTSGDAVRELRRLLGFLHGGAPTPSVAGTAGGGSLGDLDAVCATARACGVAVRVRRDGPAGRITAQVGHAAYRVVQESLTNVVKHRGPGSTAQVRLRWDSPGLVVTVSSAGGAGGPAGAGAGDRTGRGLAGLAARLADLGGEFEAGPQPDGGYRVVARLPVLEPVARSTRS